MSRQRLVPTCCLVALLLLGTVAAVPVAADGTATTAPDVSTAAQSDTNQTYNRTYDDTAFIAATRADDDSLYLAGISGNYGYGSDGPGANATLIKRAADGSTAWTKTFESRNTTAFIAAETGPSGGVYLLESSYNRSGGFSRPSVSLVRVDARGNLVWREPLPATALTGRQPMTASDDGVVLVNRTRSGLELFEYGPDGDREWRKTYDVRAQQISVDTTASGFTLAGTVNYESPWVMRIDDRGRVEFNETYPSTTIGQLADAVPTPDGGLVLVGSGDSYGDTPSSLAIGVGPDGAIRWTRVIASGENGRVSDVLPTDDGFVVVGARGFDPTGDRAVSLTRVGFDGAVRARTRVPGFTQAVVAPGPADRITIAGLTSRTPRHLRSGVRTVTLPAPDPDASAALAADASVSSGETRYRGQNLFVQSPRRAGETVSIVALPGEYDEFEPHVARRVTLNRSGIGVVETAALASGRYVVEIDDRPVFVEAGSVVNPSTREAASFELDTQNIYSHLRRGNDNGQFVDRAAGEDTATLAWDSSRQRYVAEISADRFRGGPVNESTLERLFGEVPGFRGTATVDGTPVARVTVDGETRLTVPVTSLAPGLYDVSVRGADTAEVGESASTRLVVGTTDPRPLSVSIGDEPVRVSVGNKTERNVTVSGVTNGIAAMSMSANRTGQPGVQLDLRVDINGSSSSAGAGVGPGRASADAMSMDGNTSNGTIEVGRFGVEANARDIDPDGNTTNTVTFGLDWVVDEQGVPYTVPEQMKITVEVTDIENATGESADYPPERPPKGTHRGWE